MFLLYFSFAIIYSFLLPSSIIFYMVVTYFHFFLKILASNWNERNKHQIEMRETNIANIVTNLIYNDQLLSTVFTFRKRFKFLLFALNFIFLIIKGLFTASESDFRFHFCSDQSISDKESNVALALAFPLTWYGYPRINPYSPSKRRRFRFLFRFRSVWVCLNA